MESEKQTKVLVESQGHILFITFNRPEKYNALDPESYHVLSRALFRLQHDNDLRVGVIQAAGKHFTSGLELDKWAPIFAKGGLLSVADGELDPFGVNGDILTKPVVCAVQGLCYTSGLELLLNTEIRIATPDTRFAQLEVQRGIYHCGGGTIRLPEEIGWANAQRYLLTGDEFSAQQALQWGLVQEIVELENLHQRAKELAQKIAKAAPLAVQAALKSSKIARRNSQQAALDVVLEDMPAIIQSDDAKEGITSFLERRDAKFIGS